MIHNLLLLVLQGEVTTHFRQLDAYPEPIGSVEAEMLARLRALKGMWTKPSVNNPVTPKAWPYQINRCEAYILARVASDKEEVRNLRVVLQSRTRTRKKHRPHRLIIFIDECINQFSADEAEKLHSTASQLAYAMKAARKACVKAWVRDPSREHTGGSKRTHRHHSDKQPKGSSHENHRES